MISLKPLQNIAADEREASANIIWETAEKIERPFVLYDADASDGEYWDAGKSGSKSDLSVSVVIPTLDADRDGRFKKLLRQIEGQSFSGYEMIVVKGDARQGRAINVGAALGRGEYLVTLDDDTALPDADTFKKLHDFMEENPDVGIAGGNNVIPEDAPYFIKKIMREIPRRSWEPVREVVDSDLAEHPCMIMRMDTFKQVGGENELLPRGLDPYLREQFRNAGKRVVLVPGVIYHHLPPENLLSLFRQFYRNGVQAAFVNRRYPQWVIETPAHHGRFESRVPLRRRVLRFSGSLMASLMQCRFIFFISEIAYGIGFIVGWRRMKEGGTEKAMKC